MSAKVIANMKKDTEIASDLDGFEDLGEANQKKVETAYEEGHVADEDIPDSARKEEAGDDDEGADEEKPAKKARATKKKADDDEKPKRAARGAKAKVRLLHYQKPLIQR